MGVFGILITAVSSCYLAGLSSTVQIVVYPAFALVGPEQWPRYHAAHMRAILPAVGPMWLAEAASLVLWLAARPRGTTALALVAGSAALATVVITATAAIPAHEALAAGYDRAAGLRLERANAWRTAAWTLAALAATGAVAVTIRNRA